MCTLPEVNGAEGLMYRCGRSSSSAGVRNAPRCAQRACLRPSTACGSALRILASAMDGAVSRETAGIIGRLGGLAVLNLEGIFTRYEDAEEQLERISELPKELATREMQEIYREPVKPELIARRVQE